MIPALTTTVFMMAFHVFAVGIVEVARDTVAWDLQTSPDSSKSYPICPSDTLIRPGRYADLVHGFVNHTMDTINVCYGIRGDCWPPLTSLTDPNPIFPGQTQRLWVRIRAPDSAAAGVNLITWIVDCAVEETCDYRVRVPELISSVGAEASVGRVRLSWMVADSSADTATVHRREGDGPWTAMREVFGSDGSALVFEDEGVIPGVEYDYRLGLPVEDRQIFRGEVHAVVPDLLAGASAEARPGAVVLTWLPADPVAYSAAVYRRGETGRWTLQAHITTSGGTPLTFEDRTVTPGVAYSYRLGIMVDGEEFYRGELAVVAAIADDEFRLGPVSANPASGSLRVAIILGGGEPARLDLFDTTGRLLRTQRFQEVGRFVLDAAGGIDLSGGLYFVRLAQSGRQRVLRFVVRE